MSDINQLVLIGAIAVITILLTIIGIQVAFILKELRRTIGKVNKILDDTGVLSGSVSRSVHEFNTVASGIKTGLGVFRVFAQKLHQGDEHE